MSFFYYNNYKIRIRFLNLTIYKNKNVIKKTESQLLNFFHKMSKNMGDTNITDETNYFAYEFNDSFSKIIMSRSQMEIIFERTEILEYLIIGHPQFQKEHLVIINGILKWNIDNYGLRVKSLKLWFMAILDAISVTETILEIGFAFGGSKYLDNKLLEEKKEILQNHVDNPNTPTADNNNTFSWKSYIVTSALQDEISLAIDTYQNDGYNLISSSKINETTAYPIVLTFRKRK